MFAHSIQFPTSNYSCYNTIDPNYCSSWNSQPIVSSALLQNELLNKIHSIRASDFYNLSQHPLQYAVNCGLGWNNPSPYNYNPFSNSLNCGPLGLNQQVFGSPVSSNNPFNNLMFGGGNFNPLQSNWCQVSVLDNDSEVCFECVCPGVSSNNIEINIVHNEIRVRLVSCSTNSKTSGGKSSSQNNFNGSCAPLCCLPLPSFCDPSKCSAKVDHGRILITCPRTPEYVKNITRVKVS